MKRYVSLFAVLLATSCSHSATKAPESKSDTTAKASAPAAKETAAPKAVASKEHASCKHGSDERALDVVTKGEGCAVKYTKHGQTNELASAEHETKHCADVMAKVRGHLEAAGFSCN